MRNFFAWVRYTILGMLGIKLDEGPTYTELKTVKVLDKKKPIRKATRILLFDRTLYCPICASVLVAFVLDMKECPEGHGKTLTDENRHGMPVIVFEPTED